MSEIKIFFLLTLCCLPLLAGEQTPAKTSETLENRVEKVWNLAENGQFAEAADTCAALLPLLPAQRFPELRGNLMSYWGKVLRGSNRPEEALERYRQALELRKNLPDAYANTCYNIGNCLLDLGHFSEAEKWFLDAQKRKKILDPSDLESQISIGQALGHCYLGLGKNGEAKRFFQESLNGAASVFGKNSPELIPIRQGLADFWVAAGLPDSAVLELNRAWEIQRDSLGLPESGTAELLNKMAGVFSEKGNFPEALWRFDSALAVCKNLLRRDHVLEAECQRNKGICQRDFGDFEAALQAFETAQKLFPKLDQKKTLLHDLALVHRYRGQPEKAIELLREGILFFEKEISSPEKLQAFYITMGSAQAEAGRLDSASLFFQKALNINYLGRKKDEQAAIVLNKISENSLARRQPETARQFASRALELARKIGDRKRIYTAFFHLGEAAMLEKRPSEALEFYAQADAALGIKNSGEAFPFEAVQTANARASAWSEAAKISSKKTDWQSALVWAEKGVSMLDSLQNRFRETRSDINLRDIFFSVFNTAVVACLELGQQQRAFSFSEKCKSGFLQRLSRQTNHSLPKTSLPDIQKKLPAGKTLLEFQWCDDEIALFVLRRDTFACFRLPGGDSIQQKVGRFFTLCSQNPDDLDENVEDAAHAELVAVAHELYQNLLAPAENLLTEDLILVPDGWLCYLPFAALLPEKATRPAHEFSQHAWLVRQRVLHFAWSAGLAVFFSGGAISETAPKGLLGIAPKFEGDQTSRFRKLKHNMEEVEKICARTSGDARLADAADLGTFLREAENYRVLHLSTHGEADHRDPDRPCVAFSKNAKIASPEFEHEVLAVPEIRKLKLKAELVVLSACRTASGRLFRGEGLASIGRAFQEAGARGIVASIWNVDDRQAVDFMDVFYQNLLKNRPKSVSLAAAGKSLSGQHPYFWAGFIAAGDDSALTGFGGPGAWIWVWALVTLLLVVFVLKRCKVFKTLQRR